MDILKAIELHTLNGRTVWSVTHLSIKRLPKRERKPTSKVGGREGPLFADEQRSLPDPLQVQRVPNPSLTPHSTVRTRLYHYEGLTTGLATEGNYAEICHQLNRYGHSYKLRNNLTGCPADGSWPGLLSRCQFFKQPDNTLKNSPDPTEWKPDWWSSSFRCSSNAPFLTSGPVSSEDKWNETCQSFHEWCQPWLRWCDLFQWLHRTIPSQLAGPTFPWDSAALTYHTSSILTRAPSEILCIYLLTVAISAYF